MTPAVRAGFLAAAVSGVPSTLLCATDTEVRAQKALTLDYGPRFTVLS